MISEEFKQNIESGDLDTIRSALIDYLIIDRTFRSFDEALEYAKNCMDIIEPYNNEPPFVEEPWGSNYLNQQKVALMMNFSLKRIEHIKEVILKVIPEQKIEPSPGGMKPVSQPTSQMDSRTGRRVVSQTELPKKGTPKAPASRDKQKKTPPFAPHGSEHTANSGSRRTGARVVRETVSSAKRSEEKKKSDTDTLGSALIVGGVAVAAVGIATIEPLVIGAGAVIAGAGIGVKIENRK